MEPHPRPQPDQGSQRTNDGRMPAVLTLEARQTWLYGTPAEAFACLKPYSDELTALLQYGAPGVVVGEQYEEQ